MSTLRQSTLFALPCLALALSSCSGSSNSDTDGGGPPGVPECTGQDSDGDGICDSDETKNGTDPNNADSDGDGLSDGEEIVIGTDPNNADSDGDGVNDGDEIILGTDPTVGDVACAADSAEAKAVSKPVDVIFIVDNSGSMTAEIEGIQNNIDGSFATIIGDSGIDYRIIVLAKYGDFSNQDICIQSPLSGNACVAPVLDTAPQPVLKDRFKHYSREIRSHDSFQRILATYAGNEKDSFWLAPNGWSEWLRPDAYKVFVEFTDDTAIDGDNDNIGLTAVQFDTALLALSEEQFGTAQARNYVFHSLLGMGEKAANPTQAYTPEEAIVTTKCTGGVSHGPEYQELSRLTGGLRFPLCRPDNYDVVFNQIATGVVESVGLPCSYQIPPAPEGQTVDTDKVVVTYAAQGGATAASLARVADQAACAANSWYFNVDSDVVLCPQTCDVVEADETGIVNVLIGCQGGPID